MKVLLLNPPYIKNIRFNREGRCQQKVAAFSYLMVPMSLIYSAALLRKYGFTVKVIDYMAEKNSSLQKMRDDVALFSPDLIIIAVTMPTATNDFGIVALLKEISDAHISAIGLMGSVMPQETLMQSRLDSVIRGEPEMTVLELAEALRDKKTLFHIQGLSFRQTGQLIHNTSRPRIADLDSLPFPARDLLNQKAYTLPINRRPYTFIIPSRGCVHKCIFCQVKDYYGSSLRLRSIPNVMEELDEIINKHNITDIEMYSDNFTLNRNFVVAFCEGVLKRNFRIRWMANSRVDSVDEELLALMKKAGCAGISFGVESCNQEILDNVKKGTTVAQIKNAITLCRKLNIRVLAQMVLGLPGETKETVRENLRILLQLKPNFVQFSCAIPYPKTEFHDIVVKNNWLEQPNLDLFELDKAIVSTEALSARDIKRLRLYSYRKYYLQPHTIRNIFRELHSLSDVVNLVKDCYSYFHEWVFGKK